MRGVKNFFVKKFLHQHRYHSCMMQIVTDKHDFRSEFYTEC